MSLFFGILPLFFVSLAKYCSLSHQMLVKKVPYTSVAQNTDENSLLNKDSIKMFAKICFVQNCCPKHSQKITIEKRSHRNARGNRIVRKCCPKHRQKLLSKNGDIEVIVRKVPYKIDAQNPDKKSMPGKDRIEMPVEKLTSKNAALDTVENSLPKNNRHETLVRKIAVEKCCLKHR